MYTFEYLTYAPTLINYVIEDVKKLDLMVFDKNSPQSSYIIICILLFKKENKVFNAKNKINVFAGKIYIE